MELNFLYEENSICFQKHANQGITTIESAEVLSLHPFDEYRTPPEIIRMFGTKDKYFEAVKELDNQLY